MVISIFKKKNLLIINYLMNFYILNNDITVKVKQNPLRTLFFWPFLEIGFLLDEKLEDFRGLE